VNSDYRTARRFPPLFLILRAINDVVIKTHFGESLYCVSISSFSCQAHIPKGSINLHLLCDAPEVILAGRAIKMKAVRIPHPDFEFAHDRRVCAKHTGSEYISRIQVFESNIRCCSIIVINGYLAYGIIE